jgi:1,4-alpha-glucan branching enzyme
MGYPGAGVYLDFHKKHHNSGLRYWKITGVNADLAYKQPYLADQTEWQLDLDAGDFVSLVRSELAEHSKAHGYPGMLAAPFDTELFGHWWFEGPRFLEKVMHRMTASEEIKLTDCAEALDNYTAKHSAISLPEGSWGEGGHHFVWTNNSVAWMWDTIYPLEDRFLNLIHKKKSPSKDGEDLGMVNDELRAVMEQAARELLLLEASDWQFVISTQGAVEYSKTRFAEHAGALTRLLDLAEQYDAHNGLTSDDARFLQEMRSKDMAFPKIDFGWWGKPGLEMRIM